MTLEEKVNAMATVQFLTVHEAATALRVCVTTVQRLARAGKIPGAQRVGRQWRFRADVIFAGVPVGAAPTTRQPLTRLLRML